MLLAMVTGTKTVEMMHNSITFTFIVTLVIVRHILDLTKPLTVSLQKKAMDLLKAKEEIVLLKSALTEICKLTLILDTILSMKKLLP